MVRDPFFADDTNLIHLRWKGIPQTSLRRPELVHLICFTGIVIRRDTIQQKKHPRSTLASTKQVTFHHTNPHVTFLIYSFNTPQLSFLAHPVPPLDPHPHILPKPHTPFNHKPPFPLPPHHRPKPLEERQRRLIQLHHRNILAQTNPRPIPKHHRILTILTCLFFRFKPPLWPELARVGAVDGGVALHEPGVACYFCAGGDELVV